MLKAHPTLPPAVIPGGESLIRLVRSAGLVGDVDGDGRPFRDFIDALGVALYTTDADGHLTYYNEEAARLWGRRPELGEMWCGSWKLYWSDGRPMAHEDCPMAIALKENRPVRGESAIAERPDGTRIHFQPYPSPLRDDEGRLIGGVNVLVDVTDRQLAKAKLEAASEALAISSSARDDFLGLVSHELRTPVTTIYGNARLLLDRLERFPSEEAGMIADMASDSERLLDIVENLLLLSRLQSGVEPDLEPTLLKHVVRQEVRSYTRRHPGREVTASIGGHHVVVDADRAYLMLVLQNLLSNAHKYGGEAPVEVVVEDAEGEVRVSVLDRGLGIEGLATDDLFSPFYRAKAAQKLASGLGLGLPVCRRIVEIMGGRIWALPRDGGGSEFGFALPVSADPPD